MNDTRLPPLDVLQQNVICKFCGYNLRGLSRSSYCPECGNPIAESLKGNELLNASPQWLASVRLGIILRLCNLFGGVLIGICAVALQAIGYLQPIHVLQIAVAIVWVWSTYKITAPEPATESSEGTYALRRVLRASVWITMGGTVASILGGLGNPATANAMMAGNTTVLAIIGSAASLFGIIVMCGELVYFRRFARRVPDPGLEKFLTVLLYMYPISNGVTLISSFMFLFFGVQSMGAGTPPTGILVLLGVLGCFGIITFLTVIAYVVAMFLLLRRFSDALRIAGLPPESYIDYHLQNPNSDADEPSE